MDFPGDQNKLGVGAGLRAREAVLPAEPLEAEFSGMAAGRPSPLYWLLCVAAGGRLAFPVATRS